MTNLLLLSLSLPLSAIAQESVGTAGLMRAIDGGLFDNCDRVKNRALALASGVSKPVYFFQLYAQGGTSLFFAFPSDGSTEAKIRWLDQNDSLRHQPYALFYFVRGAYTFRCRDNLGHYVEYSATPPLSPTGRGDPLRIQLSTGAATILHFWATETNMDTIYVVTETPLETLNGEEVLARIKERLGARYMFVYVRNDPWFFGYASDSIPFIFADSFRRLTELEYQATHTMVCYTNGGCKVVQSLFQKAWSR